MQYRFGAVALSVAWLFMLSTVSPAATIPDREKKRILDSNHSAEGSSVVQPVNAVNLPLDENGFVRVSEQGNNPNPKPVVVTNFPEVQTVDGTVNVGNLPAVQNVTGTVDVGNLPLAEDGSVRVTSQPPAGTRVVDLLAAPIQLNPQQAFTTDVVDVSGYEYFAYRVTASGASMEINPRWRWLNDESFTVSRDERHPANQSCSATAAYQLVCHTQGRELVLRIHNMGDTQPGTVESVRVYLFNGRP